MNRQEYFKKNLQENRSLFNQARSIKSIGNKLISLTTNAQKPKYIGDVVNIPLWTEWYN